MALSDVKIRNTKPANKQIKLFDGLTRAPSPEATASFSGCIPNRHSVSNVPEPSDIPFRASTGAWLTRRDIDVFVDACEETMKKLGMR
jgi:selenocysteine lyase/cysteine desulfurase